MSVVTPAKLHIFYDGLCPMCRFEINHYKQKPGAKKLRFVDISQPGFNAKAEGLDPEKVHKEFHVRDPHGKVYAGVDAFVQIWRELGIWGWLDNLVQLKALRPIINFGYRGFAIVRPWFRNKPEICDDNVCSRKTLY